jgi:hypothetical protein
VSLSQVDLDRLDIAIASQTLEFEIAGRRVKYRSMDELMAAREYVARQIADAAATAAGNRQATRRYTFTTMRGD